MVSPDAPPRQTGRTFEEIMPGERASIERVCRAEDLIVFAHASGALNPLNLPTADKDQDGLPDNDAVAPAMWVGSLFQAVLGNLLPGPGTVYASQSLTFHRSARVGDALSISVEVLSKGPDPLVRLRCEARGENGVLIAEGLAEVRAPRQAMSLDPASLPGLSVRRHVHVERLMEAVRGVQPLPMAVVAPEDEKALAGALLAMRRGLISPLLVGDVAALRALGAAMGEDLSDCPLIDAPTHTQAAALAVQLVHEGRAACLMKGALHSDTLLAQVVKADGGLRAGRRISHVFTFDVPGLPHLLHVSDAAIAIAPTLEEKVEIVQNAIDLAQALGAPRPRVGVLSAVETVTPRIPSTLDAAILSKMAERGQIRGGEVDGPLALDNAIDLDAARTKGIRSLVAGRADVLIVPNIEAGNILVKDLSFAAHAEGAGLVVGAKAPVVLTSRADDVGSRLMSCAIAVLFEEWRRTGASRLAPARPTNAP